MAQRLDSPCSQTNKTKTKELGVALRHKVAPAWRSLVSRCLKPKSHPAFWQGYIFKRSPDLKQPLTLKHLQLHPAKPRSTTPRNAENADIQTETARTRGKRRGGSVQRDAHIRENTKRSWFPAVGNLPLSATVRSLCAIQSIKALCFGEKCTSQSPLFLIIRS